VSAQDHDDSALPPPDPANHAGSHPLGPDATPDSGPSGPAGAGDGQHHGHGQHGDGLHLREAGEAVWAAAIEAERGTGHPEETYEEARAGVLRRLVRAVAGFLVIGIGIALLPLPGPGWVVIIVGLALLPFAWAERAIRTIRRNIPGIPEDGRIPPTTWVVMGVMVVGFTLLALKFGGTIGDWVGDRWADLGD
jgi:hypothetical protein